MSTSDKLQSILNSKADIKTAIEAKGVTVGSAPLADYDDKIASISGGAPDPVTGIAYPTLVSHDSVGGYGWGFPVHNGPINEYLNDSSLSTGFQGFEQNYQTLIYQSLMDGLSSIPFGATITNVKFTYQASKTRADHTFKTTLDMAGHAQIKGADMGFANDGNPHDYVLNLAVNPWTSNPWTLDELALLNVGIEIYITNYGYPNSDFLYTLHPEISWTYTPAVGEPDVTGIINSIVDYDDGYYKKGQPKIIVDNGNHTISLPSKKRMFAKPFKMVDGDDGIIDGNVIALTNTFNYGTISLGQHYAKGTPGGVTPNFSGSLQEYNYSYAPVSNNSIWMEPTTKIIYKSRHDSNYTYLGLNPTQPLSSQDWEQIKSHANIYICITAHDTPADKPDYDMMGGTSYLIGDIFKYDNMGSGLYWYVDTPFISSGNFYSDMINVHDVTSTVLATAFDPTKWIELTNVASAYDIGAYMPLSGDVATLCTRANSLVFADFSDWRLANYDELKELEYFTNGSSVVPLFAHPSIELSSQALPFHSSTPHASNKTTLTIGTDFTGFNMLTANYNDNFAYPIFVRDIT